MSVAVAYLSPMATWLGQRESVVAIADGDAAEVARCQAGDHAAFEVLVSRHEAEMYRVCLRLLGHPEDAIDAVQETFLRIYRAIGRFRGAASFRTWAYGIALNVCRNRLKAVSSRMAKQTSPLVEEDERTGETVELPLPDPLPGPEALAYSGELRAALKKALTAMSSEHREILVLREIEGLEYEELERLLGCAAGTVKSRLARARAALRQALQGVWP